MNNLPIELLTKILLNLLPDESCDIVSFKNYFLVNKLWKYIFNQYYFRVMYSKKLGIYNFFKKKYNSSFILNNIFNYTSLINIDCYNKLFLTYNPDLLNIIGYNTIINIPVCKFKKSCCIENLCKTKCYFKHHNIFKYLTNPLMRGIDDLKRHYLVFLYKDLTTNKLNYEFIYHKVNNKQEYITFAGKLNKTYIGMLSSNIPDDHLFYRELNRESYMYMKKLVNNEYCGRPEYDPHHDCFIEGTEGDITLFY